MVTHEGFYSNTQAQLNQQERKDQGEKSREGEREGGKEGRTEGWREEEMEGQGIDMQVK